jgi:hypothetical protein
VDLRTLTAIFPVKVKGRPTITKSFSDERSATDFIRHYNVDHNVYYSVNPLKNNNATKKAEKANTAQTEYLHVDADPNDGESPEAFKERLLPLIQARSILPSLIVDSGNGMNLLWRLETPVIVTSPEIIADIEARNVKLAADLGAPAGTADICRILRLPGTINYPTEAKVKKGRAKCETRLISAVDNRWPLDAFPPAPKPEPPPRKPGGERKLPPALASLLHIEGHGAYESRSELLFAFINAALRTGIDEGVIIDDCLDSAFEGKGIYEHVRENGGGKYVERQIEHALNKGDKPTPAPSKMVIRVKPGDRHNVVNATEAALIRAERPVFYRGGMLVEPIYRMEKDDDERPLLSLRFEPFNAPRLAYMTAKHAVIFQRYHDQKKRWINIDPPDKVIEMLLDLNHWGFPTVRGIINSPTMRRDGTIITEPGYDVKTKLWYKPVANIELLHIPDKPTRKDAEKALDQLRGLIVEFPFTDEKEDHKGVSEAVAISGMFSVVMRGAFPVSPLFFLVAPGNRQREKLLG